MVDLSGEILSPLISLYVFSFVILFAFLKEIKYEHSNRFLFGMLAGVAIYGLLMLGSTFPKSETESMLNVSLMSVVYGGSIYGLLIFLIGWNTIIVIFTDNHLKPGFLAGISISFVIFEIYFVLRCVETIPFMANVVKHSC